MAEKKVKKSSYYSEQNFAIIDKVARSNGLNFGSWQRYCTLMKSKEVLKSSGKAGI